MTGKLGAAITLAALIAAFVAFGGWAEFSRLVGLGHQPEPFVDHGISDDDAFFKRPPQTLPIRPIDYIRFPHAGFGFVLTSSTGFQVDTFRGTVTKDLVSDPDTTITLQLSPAEMDSIYRAMIAMRFFDLPKPHPPFHHESMPQPSFTTTIEGRAGLAVQRLEWSTSDGRPSDDWKRLYRLVGMIESIVEKRKEWLALPPARGGYQ